MWRSQNCVPKREARLIRFFLYRILLLPPLEAGRICHPWIYVPNQNDFNLSIIPHVLPCSPTYNFLIFHLRLLTGQSHFLVPFTFRCQLMNLNKGKIFFAKLKFVYKLKEVARTQWLKPKKEFNENLYLH